MNFDHKYKFGILILAAGKSERMGSPKALLKINNQTFISMMLNNHFLKQKSVKILIVLGHHEKSIRAVIPDTLEMVVNSNYEAGKTGSIQCGIRALKNIVDGVFIWPVDTPLIKPEIFEKMYAEFKGPNSILIPSYQMKRGHPPLIGSDYFDAILSFDPDEPFRNLYRLYPESIIHINTEDPCVLHNINTLDTYEKFKLTYEGKSSTS